MSKRPPTAPTVPLSPVAKAGDVRRESFAVLLAATDRGGQRVVGCCEAASAQGVHPGMTMAHARAVLKDIAVHVEVHDPAADASALQRLARWMLRFAPVVSVDLPDGLLLDLSGCERLFNGVGCHVDAILAALNRLLLPARLAAGPTVGCAWAMARYGAARSILVRSREHIATALSPLPVEALRIDAACVKSLADVEIRRVGELLCVPRGELTARFGRGLLMRIDQALGNVEEDIEPITPSRPLAVSRVFEGPVKRIEVIEQCVHLLLSGLLAEAERRDCGVRGLEVELRRVDVPPVQVTLSLSYPTRSGEHLWRLLRPRVERLHLGYGVEEVYLRATAAQRLRAVQSSLGSDWLLLESGESAGDESAGAETLGVLIDQLVERMGRDAVTRAAPVESHLPESAFVCFAAVDADDSHGRRGSPRSDPRGRRRKGGSAAEDAALSGAGSTRRRRSQPDRQARGLADENRLLSMTSADRPSRLYESPEPARVISLLPDGPPVWLEWSGMRGAVQSGRGPERIASPWWQGSGRSRDYYEVQDESGRWLWVYRERETGQWYVQGEWG